jgi:hypothetical protein
MAERGTNEIRQEMAVERQRLEEAREGLQAELRSLVPVAIAGVVVLGIISTRVGIRAGIAMVRRLS